MQNKIRIGIDIGGTFTDVVVVEAELGSFKIYKVPSTPADYVIGIRSALGKLLAENEWNPEDIEFFFHGTTIATNTVIEKKGAKTGLLTTSGFRDVLEVGRTERRPIDLYNLGMERPRPLVSRRLRQGVNERINYKGEVVTPLDADAVRNTIKRMAEAGINALAISFINSYVNPVHELEAREIVRSVDPNLYVAISSEVNPQFKEFERTSTTVLSAYVGPRVVLYMETLKQMLSQLGVKSPPHIMQASGGVMTVDAVKDRAIHTILSGPAAGVLGAQKVGADVNVTDFVSFDMGGTSTDVSLAKNGQFRIVEESREPGYYLRIPMMDIITIGAGGGSIAHIDSGGVLKVGPESAGAEPGPACYGVGDEATVTDAHIALGYIDADYFLGGEMGLDVERARAAIEDRIAKPLGINFEKAATGILKVANANMVRAIKRVSIERGHDLRDFSLVPFGGAGTLHANQLMRDLTMPRVIVPRYPGVLSACGLVEADLEYQHVQSIIEPLQNLDGRGLRAYFAKLEERGRRDLFSAGISESAIQFKRAANLRYRKQVRQVTVDLGGRAPSPNWLRKQFRKVHERLYGYSTDEPVEVVDIRVASIYPLAKRISWSKGLEQGKEPLKGTRKAYFEDLGGFIDCPVYYRSRLSLKSVIEGPGIIEQDETNVIILPGCLLKVHSSGNLFISEGQTRNTV